MKHAFNLATAGLLAYFFHWGVGVALIIGLVAMAYFLTAIPIIGPFLTGMREHLLWAAFAVAVFLVGMYVGHKDAKARYEKKQDVTQTNVDNAVRSTTTPEARERLDRWDSPHYIYIDPQSGPQYMTITPEKK